MLCPWVLHHLLSRPAASDTTDSSPSFNALVLSKITSRVALDMCESAYPCLSPPLARKDEAPGLQIKTLLRSPVSVPCLSFHSYKFLPHCWLQGTLIKHISIV